MTIRSYTADDFPTVEQWARARNMQIVPQLLSPNGFLVEDDKGPVLVAFGYLLFDCPIVQIDHLLGRPEASIKTIRRAWMMIQRAIIEWVQNINKDCGFDYRVIRGFVEPRTAIESEKIGWNVDQTSLNCIRHVIP
jgi:hypothetical protein